MKTENHNLNFSICRRASSDTGDGDAHIRRSSRTRGRRKEEGRKERKEGRRAEVDFSVSVGVLNGVNSLNSLGLKNWFSAFDALCIFDPIFGALTPFYTVRNGEIMGLETTPHFLPVLYVVKRGSLM